MPSRERQGFVNVVKGAEKVEDIQERRLAAKVPHAVVMVISLACRLR